MIQVYIIAGNIFCAFCLEKKIVVGVITLAELIWPIYFNQIIKSFNSNYFVSNVSISGSVSQMEQWLH